MQIPSPQAVSRGWRCLSESDLAAYADGGLTGGRKKRCQRHVAGCEYCRHELAFLLRVERMTTHPLAPGWMERAHAVADQRGAAVAFGWAWAAAAVLVLCAAWGAWRLTLPPTQPVAVTTPPASGATPPVAQVHEPLSAEAPQVRHFGRAEPLIVVSVERGPSGPGVEFRWKPVASAVRYELRLLDAAGDTVWQAHTRGEQLPLPASIPLKKGQKYFVVISAVLPNGRALRSQATPFEAATGQERR